MESLIMISFLILLSVASLEGHIHKKSFASHFYDPTDKRMANSVITPNLFKHPQIRLYSKQERLFYDDMKQQPIFEPRNKWAHIAMDTYISSKPSSLKLQSIIAKIATTAEPYTNKSSSTISTHVPNSSSNKWITPESSTFLSTSQSPSRLQQTTTLDTSTNESFLMSVPKPRSSNSIFQKDMDEFFSPQLPLPAEEHFLVIEGSSPNTSQNCSFEHPCEHAPVFEHSTMVKVVILLTIAGLSIVGNVATLYSIVRTGRQTTSTVYILLVQLAIADLLVATFCLMADAFWKMTVQWYGGNGLCKFVKFMQMFALYLSTYVLVLIGFDRLCAIRFPMARIRAKYYVRNGIICIWTISAVFSSPQAFIFSVMRGPFVEEFHQCVTFAFYSAPWQEQLYTSISLVLMFLLPLVTLLVTYVTTFVTIASQENTFSERRRLSALEDARHKILQRAKIKTLMVTVVIVLTFVVCWTPYYVTMIIFVFSEPDEQLSQGLQTFVFFFGSLTAMLNPLIYGAFHLRRKGGQPPNKSTTGANHSSSSRVEMSLTTLHRDRV